MTLPPLRNAISFWTIAIDHYEWFNHWCVSAMDDVFVSPNGYPATKALVALPSREMAKAFLSANREIIDRRCASKPGFIAYSIIERKSYWPIKYHELVDLAKVGIKGRPRNKAQRSK